MYPALFALIQLLNLPLMVIGWLLPPPVAQMLWLWWNDDDAALIEAMPRQWDQYVYLAWRNPVANLRHVPGVSGKGRPLYYRNWTVKGRMFYFKAGWMSDGYPALSIGAGKGF